MTKLSIGGRSCGKDRRSDQVKEAMLVQLASIGRALIAGVAAPPMTTITAGSANSEG